jgi:hypothetical protein
MRAEAAFALPTAAVSLIVTFYFLRLPPSRFLFFCFFFLLVDLTYVFYILGSMCWSVYIDSTLDSVDSFRPSDTSFLSEPDSPLTSLSSARSSTSQGDHKAGINELQPSRLLPATAHLAALFASASDFDGSPPYEPPLTQREALPTLSSVALREMSLHRALTMLEPPASSAHLPPAAPESAELTSAGLDDVSEGEEPSPVPTREITDPLPADPARGESEQALIERGMGDNDSALRSPSLLHGGTVQNGGISASSEFLAVKLAQQQQASVSAPVPATGTRLQPITAAADPGQAVLTRVALADAAAPNASQNFAQKWKSTLSFGRNFNTRANLSASGAEPVADSSGKGERTSAQQKHSTPNNSVPSRGLWRRVPGTA